MRVPRIGTGLPLGCKPQSNYFPSDLRRTLTGNPEFSSSNSDQQPFSCTRCSSVACFSGDWWSLMRAARQACGPGGRPFLKEDIELLVAGSGVERKRNV